MGHVYLRLILIEFLAMTLEQSKFLQTEIYVQCGFHLIARQLLLELQLQEHLLVVQVLGGDGLGVARRREAVWPHPFRLWRPCGLRLLLLLPL